MSDQLPPPTWIILPRQFTAIRFWHENTHVLNFRVFNCVHVTDYKSESPPVWELFEGGDGPKSLDQWEDHYWEIDGSIKWDGCVNWQTNPECMAHGCSPSYHSTISDIFAAVYNLGKRHFDLLGDEPPPMPEFEELPG